MTNLFFLEVIKKSLSGHLTFAITHKFFFMHDILNLKIFWGQKGWVIYCLYDAALL